MGQVDLEKMKETDIREADINALADILEMAKKRRKRFSFSTDLVKMSQTIPP